MSTPPSRIVLAYVGTAHLALLGAAVLAVVAADELAQSYLHPRVLALVHLVTLGWLTSTALGAVYALLPMVLRARVVVRWPDVVACIAVLAGSSGVVAHMGLATYSGLAWSGGTIAVGAAWVGIRATFSLWPTTTPRLQKISIPLALFGLVAAACLGALVAVDRGSPLFGGGHLRAIAAHAHLALVGWLLLLTVGVGQRLLPMLLAAHPNRGRRPILIVSLLALGAFTLPTLWLLSPPGSRWSFVAALPIGAGLALFAWDLLALRRHAVPKARDLPRHDPALVLIACAPICLVAALVLGLTMLVADLDSGYAALYGVLVLFGGFGSLVLGVGLRLWPLFAYMRAFARAGAVPESTPAMLPSYRLQWTVVGAWIFTGVLLGIGVTTHHGTLVRAGGLTWTLATLAAIANFGLVLMRARRTRRMAVIGG